MSRQRGADQRGSPRAVAQDGVLDVFAAAGLNKPDVWILSDEFLNEVREPGTRDELVEEIYMHTLPLAIFAAIQTTPPPRVTWPQDDDIAARVMTAAAAPKGGVQ